MSQDKHVIAMAPNYWGRGDTKEEAFAALKKERGTVKKRQVRYFEVPRGTVVNDMGGFTYFPPEGKTWDDLGDRAAQRAYCDYTEL